MSKPINRKIWEPTEVKYLKEHYPDELTAVIAKNLDRSLGSVYTQANLMGLKKSEAFIKSDLSGRLTSLRSKGNNYRFKKGLIPHNKGKKRSDYCSTEAIEKCKNTQFKPGQKIHNEYPVGSIVVRQSHGIKIPHIKISNSVWMPLKNKIWIDANGEIPKKHVVRIKDGNVFNCQLENLELISMKENMLKNSIVNIPEELLPLVKLNNKLKKTINEKLK